MSRTDHHQPLWVNATWWEPWHNRCPHSIYWQYRDGRPCELPPEPVVEHPRTRRNPRPCHWIPVDDRYGPSRYFGSVPRWYVRHAYHARQRTQHRTDRQRLIAEHRATGSVDHVPVPEQARSAARWYYW